MSGLRTNRSWHLQSTMIRHGLDICKRRCDSSVDIIDSNLDERFRLWSALRASIRAKGFHTCIGPRRALRASIQVLGEFRSSSIKVFDCFGVHLLALTRASEFPARFGGYHQHLLVGAAPALRAGAGNDPGRAPEPGADGQPPAASLRGPLCSLWILLYFGIFTVAT